MVKHLEQRRKDEEGFTLIELMVVVLILGILMAIAIPTFLSTTKSAKGVAAESNATNAATSEISNYSTSQLFDSSAFAGGTALLDPALPWDQTTTDTTAPSGKILVLVSSAPWATVTWVNTAAATGTIMFLESLSSNGTCYIVLDDQSTATPNVGYFVDTAGCPAAPSVAPTTATTPPGAGSASAHTGVALPAAWAGYWSNF